MTASLTTKDGSTTFGGTGRTPRGVRAAAHVHPLRAAMAQGKMPVIIEMHLTEGDHVGYQHLRRRFTADGEVLPNLAVLGQYVRQADGTDEDLTAPEKRLVVKLQTYAELLSSGQVDLVALDDGARGAVALDNTVAAELLIGLGTEPARIMPNVVARNRFAGQICERLTHLAGLGIRTALLLTGDLPADPKTKVFFPLDSIGMCELARRMALEGTLPDDFLVAAAGHPNPDADPDGFRTLHKALAGAQVIVTQAIFSAPVFESWMDVLRRLGVLDMVEVMAEVIPITSARQLQTLSEIPGIRVPEELSRAFSAHEERLATSATAAGEDDRWVRAETNREGVRVTRELLHTIRKVPGVSGFYFGCVRSLEVQNALLRETPLVPVNPQAAGRIAKLTGSDRQHVLAQRPVIDHVIREIMKKAGDQSHGMWRSAMKGLASRPGIVRALRVLEWPKTIVFGCKGCDRCDLSVDALVCPRGCAKQMTHGPCGAPRLVDGRYLCEDTSRECTWGAIRSRRQLYGISVETQLSSRQAPSDSFYQGDRFSAIVPVLRGEKESPQWSLAFRAPWAHLRAALGGNAARDQVPGAKLDLAILVATRSEPLLAMLRENPDMEHEEVTLKALALVGGPQALHLIESTLVELGFPAEGSLGDLSIREKFQLAEAVPRIRDSTSGSETSTTPRMGRGRYDELLAVVREGSAIRKAMRRDLVNGLVRHVGMLGVRVTYAETLLAKANVDAFLEALAALKDELQFARTRLTDVFGRFSVYFNRIHYKHHYRAPIAIQSFCGEGETYREMVIDMGQFDALECFRTDVRRAIESLIAGKGESDGDVALESFAPESQSVAWSFNRAFWSRLKEFEQATGVNYDESIGGSTDRNVSYVRSTARAYVDRLSSYTKDDGAFYVVEVGVASPHRARTFLDEVKRISDLHHSHVYERTAYVLADYSESILQSSVEELRPNHENIEAVRIEASDPQKALAPYRGHIQHVHICNVYDNLPTDKVGWIDEQLYLIESRLYLSRDALESLVQRHGLEPSDAGDIADRVGSLAESRDDGVSALLEWVRERLVARGKDRLAYVAFWMELFNALRAQERYVKIDNLNELPLGNIAGLDQPLELLRKQFTGHRNVRVHLNQSALAGFVRMLDLLHPLGTLEVVDIFVQRIEEYFTRFKGPAKYDGSTVNWLNGPLFRAVAEQLGYAVRFHSFKPYDPKSASVIMLASRRREEAAVELEED